MKNYHVRDMCGRIAGTTQALSATDAALHFANMLLKQQKFDESVVVFEVEIDDNIVRVSVHLDHTEEKDETLHFPDNVLEPLETPLALTLTKRYKNTDGRPTKIAK